MKAIGDRIVVQLYHKDVTDGGVHIPGPDRSEARIGEVVSVGLGFHSGGTWVDLADFVEPGDFVLLDPNRGCGFEYKRQKYLVISFHDIGVNFGKLIEHSREADHELERLREEVSAG